MKATLLNSGKSYNGVLYKNFKVIEMTRFMSWAIGFGYLYDDMKYTCLDMYTNEDIHGHVYYIPVLNDCMAKDTFINWVNTAKHYTEDGVYEYSNYKRVISQCEEFEKKYYGKTQKYFNEKSDFTFENQK